MADSKHVEILVRGVEIWNQWREKNRNLIPDLCKINLHQVNLNRYNLRDANLHEARLIGSSLRETNLFSANLSHSDFHGTDLRQAQLGLADLRSADLSSSNLSDALLQGANLGYVNLCNTELFRANLFGADLSNAKLNSSKAYGANFKKADLSYSEITEADLREVNLLEASLIGADLRNSDLNYAYLAGAALSGASLVGANMSNSNLNGASLSKADLSDASLIRAQALGTSFSGASFTGACLEDWNTNSLTNYEGVVCKYIYLKENQKDRRPRVGYFNSGELSTLLQYVTDTIDLVFKDGIDWKAFFQSFQDLRSQYADQDISIQAIERKQDGAFIVRLEVPSDANKSAIESSAKELYETKLTLMEQRYRDVLQAKEGEIVAYKEQSANLMEILQLQLTRSVTSEPRQTINVNGPVGNLAGTNYGNMSAIQNNYGSNAEDITRLLAALRDQAQAFSEGHKEDALDTLDVLHGEIEKPEPDKARIGRWVKRLGAIATLTAATTGFSADLAQLADYLEVPAPEIIQVDPE